MTCVGGTVSEVDVLIKSLFAERATEELTKFVSSPVMGADVADHVH